MLKISQKLEYAIRAMIELAERRDEDTLVPAREIAERQQIPLRFLEAWIDESYRAVAPKRLLAELDELHQPHRSRDEQLP